MNHTFSAPVTAAQRQRDTLLGALVGLARSTVNEPKTEDTDRILAAGLRLPVCGWRLTRRPPRARCSG